MLKEPAIVRACFPARSSGRLTTPNAHIHGGSGGRQHIKDMIEKLYAAVQEAAPRRILRVLSAK